MDSLGQKSMLTCGSTAAVINAFPNHSDPTTDNPIARQPEPEISPPVLA